MKKIALGLFTISMLSMAEIQKPFVTIKAGIDVGARYTPLSDDGINLTEDRSSSAVSGGEVALEFTKEKNQNFEYGFGIGYQKHNAPKDKKIPSVATISSVGFQSVPVYLTGKYYFPDMEEKIYMKCDLGYSFNNATDKNLKIVLEDGETGIFPVKVKNGGYYAIGLGMEVDNFVTEIMYKLNTAKLTDKAKDEESEEYTYNYSRVTLSIGYKF